MLGRSSRRTETNRKLGTSGSEEWREADVRRAFRPGSWPYLGFLLITWYGTSYSQEHPLVFWLFGGLTVATSAARLFIVHSKRIPLVGDSIWRAWLFTLLVISGLTWGAFLAATLQIYKFLDTAPLLFLVCTAGITAGAITAYHPKLALLTSYLLVLLVPSILVEFSLDDKIGKPMAAMSSLFLFFLIWQGRILNRSYHEKARNEALLTERARACRCE